MNKELITKLRKQSKVDSKKIAESCFDFGDGIDKAVDIWLEQFAEQIVLECVEVCKSRVGNSDYNTGRMHCVSDLKEHFGV
jgi:hypothetical protein